MTASSGVSFTIPSTSSQFGPRLGQIAIQRHDEQGFSFPTPTLISSTSRGVIPHLSRDHYHATKAVKIVQAPFETFLEHVPPVPILQPGKHPLHRFLGFAPDKHLLLMSVRDPADGRVMPPNGVNHVSALCVRGVRKVTTRDWRLYAAKCQPDLIIPLSDTPFTGSPYSQKRLTKSIERSAAWLSTFLQRSADVESSDTNGFSPPSILVHMAGGTSIPARRSFAESLVEKLFGKEAEDVRPLKCLDEGVSGYVFDLTPLRQCLLEDDPNPTSQTDHAEKILDLIQTSLKPLPTDKIRYVTCTKGPHEMLRLIRDVGIDTFDAGWAQEAANVGVALDFCFPAPSSIPSESALQKEKRDLGHNLYHNVFELDFGRLSDVLSDGSSAQAKGDTSQLSCACSACSPITPISQVSHSTLSDFEQVTSSDSGIMPPYSRAYIHHLLHTHEMSAHSLLAMHNLTVLDSFFEGVRAELAKGSVDDFEAEVARFEETFEEGSMTFDEARASWREVDLARGKGRLARERAQASTAI